MVGKRRLCWQVESWHGGNGCDGPMGPVPQCGSDGVGMLGDGTGTLGDGVDMLREGACELLLTAGGNARRCMAACMVSFIHRVCTLSWSTPSLSALSLISALKRLLWMPSSC